MDGTNMEVEIGVPSEPETRVAAVPKPVNADRVDAGEIHAWLEQQGYTLDGVWVQRDGTVIVANPSDAKAVTRALEGYSGYVSPEDERRAALALVVVEIAAKPEKERTLAERAILLMT